MADGKWVPVFHEDLIRHHEAIWHDNDALATWLRLLALADKQWPSKPELPRSAKSPIVARLVADSLLELLPHDCYTVAGLDARRTAASNAASNAARIRHGNAASNAEIMPTKPDQTRPEISDGATTTVPRTRGTKGGLQSLGDILTARAK